MECAKPPTIWEKQIELKGTSLPQSVLLPGDGALPALQVKSTLRGSLGLCDKPERVVAAPLLTGNDQVSIRSRACTAQIVVSLTAPLEGDSGTETFWMVIMTSSVRWVGGQHSPERDDEKMEVGKKRVEEEEEGKASEEFKAVPLLPGAAQLH